MRKTGKVLTVVCSAVLLVTASVFGTLAYLQDEESVTNTFTVGKVGIKLDETDVDVNGVKDGDVRVQENTYHLIPGKEYTKDPMVTVLKDSEESYVRMMVTINEQADLDAIFAANGGSPLHVFFQGFDPQYWTLVGNGVENDDDTRTYEFRYHNQVTSSAARQGRATAPATPGADLELTPLFTSIQVPAEVTKEQLATIEDLKIDIVAHAIQAAGFEDADQAWEAFEQAASGTTGE